LANQTNSPKLALSAAAGIAKLYNHQLNSCRLSAFDASNLKFFMPFLEGCEQGKKSKFENCKIFTFSICRLC
jgi:hypothetical protein